MKIIHAFCKRKLPTEVVVWRNGSIEEMVKEFPSLKQLVEELKAETNWPRPYKKGEEEWVALFYQDSVLGEPTEFSLRIRQGSFESEREPLKRKSKKPVNLRDVKKLLALELYVHHK